MPEAESSRPPKEPGKPVRPILLWTLVGLLILLSAGVAAVRMEDPEARTRLYFDTVGKWPILPVRSLFEPLTPIWVELEPQVKMKLDPYDLVSERLLQRGYWERDIWARIEGQLPEGGVFIDVGAHIGYYSLKAARKVGPLGTVVAVEPNPETLEKLHANIGANHAAGVVQVQPVACSDVESLLELFAAPRSNTGETSLSKVNASQEGQATRSYQVRARPLDDVLDDLGVTRVDVLKIDVEGADLLVLKGAGRALDRFRPVIFVETVDRQLKEMGGSVDELVSFVQSHGYKVGRRFGEWNTEFVPVP